MIQLLPQLKILLACQPVDFRKGIDGLIGFCRAQFDAELYDGTLFVFRNHRGTALKVLTFDGVGWWLAIRRFSQGRLRWWPKAQADTLTHPLEAQQLQVRAWSGKEVTLPLLPPLGTDRASFPAISSSLSNVLL
jgi:transposase